MKAIIYNGKDAEYRTDYPIPVCGEGESLIRIHLAAVCSTDKEVRKGYRPDFRGVMGHEFVGTVISSPDFSLCGRRVVGELNAACGKCIYCRTGRPTHCSHRRVLGMHEKDGAFAQYMTIDTGLLHTVPDSLPDAVAVYTEPLAAALEILTQVHISPVQPVAVLGDGRLALMVTQVLRLNGADVTVVGKHSEKLELFSAFAKVTTQAQPESFEFVADCTGSPSGFELAMQLVRKKGTIILKSTYVGRASVDMSMIAVNEITVVGSRCGPFEPALRLLDRGDVLLPPIELYPLEKYEDAFASDAFKAGFDLR